MGILLKNKNKTNYDPHIHFLIFLNLTILIFKFKVFKINIELF